MIGDRLFVGQKRYKIINQLNINLQTPMTPKLRLSFGAIDR